MGKKFVLDRRTMLRGMLAGAGVAVGLPALEAMYATDREAYAAPGALRFLVWFFGNGVLPYEWDPTMTGPGWTSPQTAPLDLDPAVKEYVSILTGFNNKIPNDMKITHHEGMTIFNGYPYQYAGGLTSFAGGPTLDQVIAQKLAGQTTINSLQLGVSRRLSYMDGGTSMHVLSHAAAGQAGALPPQFNPQNVWNTIFGSFQAPDDHTNILRGNVLDAVKESSNKLKTRLGKLDTERLDAHLTGIAALQDKIKALPPPCRVPPMPTETNPEGGQEHIDETIDAMQGLIVQALKCDLTRVASLLVHGGAAATAFTNLGQSVEHHNDNSHQQVANWESNLDAVVKWHMGKLQKLLATMYETEDGVTGKNLLDNSVVFVSSDCSEGWTHSVDDQPMLVCGGGGGQLKYPGVHYQSPSGENPSNVLLTMLQCFDPTATTVGGGVMQSSTPCAQIKAG